MVQEEIRKGPWTEQEDDQLVFYVNLFGDRRWDFVAKVSGSKRTGKSCRLRWVNYLHPGLKRGKMTPHEERLVVELHSKLGNRWSRIARKLPGRTDNEIKNYWRTHMRKKAQEKKKALSPSSSSSSSSSSLTSCSSNSSSKGNSPSVLESAAIASETKEKNFQEAGGCFPPMTKLAKKADEEKEDLENNKVYLMDEVWKDFEYLYPEEGESYLSGETMASPVWDMPLWATDDQESNVFPHTTSEQLYSFHNQEIFNML